MKKVVFAVILFILSAVNGQDSDWKPIVGQTYTRVTHRNPKTGTITLDTSDGLVASENTVTFHGTQFAADDSVLKVGPTPLITSIDTQILGQSEISDDYEGRFLNGIGSATVSMFMMFYHIGSDSEIVVKT